MGTISDYILMGTISDYILMGTISDYILMGNISDYILMGTISDYILTVAGMYPETIPGMGRWVRVPGAGGLALA